MSILLKNTILNPETAAFLEKNGYQSLDDLLNKPTNWIQYTCAANNADFYQGNIESFLHQYQLLGSQGVMKFKSSKWTLPPELLRTIERKILTERFVAVDKLRLDFKDQFGKSRSSEIYRVLKKELGSRYVFSDGEYIIGNPGTEPSRKAMILNMIIANGGHAVSIYDAAKALGLDPKTMSQYLHKEILDPLVLWKVDNVWSARYFHYSADFAEALKNFFSLYADVEVKTQAVFDVLFTREIQSLPEMKNLTVGDKNTFVIEALKRSNMYDSIDVNLVSNTFKKKKINQDIFFFGF